MTTSSAALVAGSVVSFMAQVPPAHRESVMLALLMAEYSTAKAMEQGHGINWLEFYRNQLRYYGWDATTPQQVHWPDSRRDELRDDALHAIGKTAGEQHVEAMKLAFAGLREQPPTLLQFEQRALQTGHFRLLPCAPAGANRVDMVLYHEASEARHLTSGFLFRQRRQSQVRAELVRFNVRLFDQTVREKVERSLAEIQGQQIDRLRLPELPSG
ncbi:hypothetical protein [Pseudomonas cremoricolorata]|uniref:Uncharacterized protein n=1 Tax=Pseudomonas cremoricolorata TaxID=157783 RepID=A0A089WS43_9PSED|nr:hypothetical protein [Pseudomonas cremoricolorata]AIR89317.1 hypothetical protein LK03_08510 [Pseudomonas cremoricolorata]